MKAALPNPDTGALEWRDAPDPRCGDGDVLVEVRAAGVNRADLAQKAGRYPPPPGVTEILGLEAAGVVSAVGSSVREWKIGDRVCALLPGGGYASLAAVPAGLLIPIPDGWSFEEAGALPEAHLTAYINLFEEAGLKRGENLLIHGGASGVGLAALALAVKAGASAFVTVGSSEKAERCLQLGASRAINYKQRDFSDALEDTGGMNVILDMIGAPYAEANLRLLADKGRIVYIAFMGGALAGIHIPTLMKKRARLIGSVLRSRPLEEKIRHTRSFTDRFGQDLRDGSLKPVIDAVYPIAEVEQAHARMGTNANIGKIALRVS